MGGNAWYRTATRWCQTNLTEIDGRDCDVGWWRRYWHDNHIQGIIVNGGGIVSYYPSENPLAYRSKYLGERDLLGEFTSAARADGLRVIVRMDINGAGEALYAQHPEWFSRDREGRPINPLGYYYSCITSGYYQEYVPDIFREIIDRYHPDGFADNAWSGMRRGTICYCGTCRKRFLSECGMELPERADWDDPAYRRWVLWSQDIRAQNWKFFNQVTEKHGGPDCLWLGMLQPNPAGEGLLYDLRDVTRDAKLLLVDSQRRDNVGGFEQNAINANMLHSLAGWDTVIIESMANYINASYLFRVGSNPPEETRHWMREGIAGGVSPWVHFIGSRHEDTRQYATPGPMLSWHRDNAQYLLNRAPVASVGLLWNGRNNLFYGRDDELRRVRQPQRGFIEAMLRGRIPFLPVHADDVGEQTGELAVLVLPDVAVLDDGQVAALEGYVHSGGSLVATGASGMLDGEGALRESFPLDSLLGIERLNRTIHPLKDGQHIHSPDISLHNYMRLPKERHPILAGFEGAGILPLGAQLYEVAPAEGMEALCTMVPPFPFYPPERAYMEPGNGDSGIPVILAGETAWGGRVVYLAADLDRRYAQLNLCDHGDILAAAVRWAARGRVPFTVESPGTLDCWLYRQENRLVMHLVNLTGCHKRPGFVEELPPLYGVKVTLDTCGCSPNHAALRVSGGCVPVEPAGQGRVSFVVPRLDYHELAVLE